MKNLLLLIFILVISQPAFAASASVSIAPSSNPVTFGAALTVSATITPANATGTVVFYDGVFILGFAKLGNGTAALTTSQLSAGRHSLSALYTGDGTFGPAASPVTDEIVSAAAGNGFASPIELFGSSSIAVADLNHDGRPDFVAGGASLVAQLNNGDGTFTQTYTYTALFNGVVMLADLNGDGFADIITTAGNALLVFLGKGDGTFNDPASYPVPAGAMVVGDFNRDGKVDVAAVTTNTILILEGKGDGTLQPPQGYPMASQPSGLVVGDFKGDGISSLAFLNPTDIEGGSGTVTVLPGKVDGTFGLGTIFPIEGNPVSIAVGDFNGDGIADLAVAMLEPSGPVSLKILLGSGTGSLIPLAPLPFGTTSNGFQLATSDFNGDGKLDIATGSAVLLGNGDGTFTVSAAPIPYGFYAVADFDGNGTADVAVAFEGTQILLGTTPMDLDIVSSHSGVFQLNQTGVTFTLTVTNNGPKSTVGTVTVTDAAPNYFQPTSIAGQGWSCPNFLPFSCTRSDPLAAGASFPPITVAMAVESGAPAENPNVATVTGFGDINPANNSATDIAIVVQPQTIGFGTLPDRGLSASPFTLNAVATSGLQVSFMATGSCTVSGASVTLTGVGTCTITASQAGNIEYFAASNVTQSFRVLSANSNISMTASPNPSRFGSQVTLTANITPASATGKVTFYDGASILGTAGVSSGVAALRATVNSTGRRALSGHYTGDVNTPPSDSASVVQIVNSVGSLGFKSSSLPSIATISAIGDFNNDGKQDLLVTGGGVFLGNGDGTFQSPPLTSAPQSSIVAADFNLDGNLDYAAVEAGFNSVSVFPGNGNATFGSAITTSAPANYFLGILAVADFNSDGIPDLAASTALGLAILLGNGDGTFKITVLSNPAGIAPGSLAVGDLNGDGILDLVGPAGAGYVVALGLGGGAFGPFVQQSLPLILEVGPSLALSDLNGDGILDLVLENGFNGSVAVALGKGDGTFSAPIGYSASVFSNGAAPSIFTNDFYGDGKQDIFSGLTNLASGFLQVFHGNGDGTFASPNLLPLVSGRIVSVLQGDFNGDGRVDLAVQFQDQPTTILLGSSNVPLFNVTETQTGDFIENQTGTFTITVANAGLSATNGTVTLTPTSGFTFSSLSGTGWTCSTIACTRADPLAPGAPYPAITGTVAVGFAGGPPVVNVVTASGGGSLTVTASATVSIVAQGCPFSLNPASDSISPLGGSGSIAVSASDSQGCSWLVTSNAPWLTVTSGPFGIRSSTVTYLATANLSGAPRAGTLSIGNLTFTLSQSAITSNTPNFVGKFVTNSVIGNSAMYEVNGNAGISTTVPAISLDVRTGALPQMGVAQTTDYLTVFASDIYGPALYWDPAKDLRFGKGGTGLFNPFGFVEQMRIQSSTGNVGIATQSPGSKLDVNGDINFIAAILLQETPVLRLGNAFSGGLASANLALGIGALASAVTGTQNTAAGTNAQSNNSLGSGNTALGAFSLLASQSGIGNTAIGVSALGTSTTGSSNLAIGQSAAFGVAITNGNNIHIGTPGVFADNAVTRIGGENAQGSFFASGIRGVTTGNQNAIPLMIDSNGQLGTVGSSRRFKEDIRDMGAASLKLLRLQPVTFRYIQPFADGSKPIQYGLVSEDVDKAFPDLVAHSADGRIETVKYQEIGSILLDRVQRQQADISRLKKEIDEEDRRGEVLQERLLRLTSAVERLVGGKDQ